MDTKRTGGFTLVELLVVIAILSVLAAILFPVFEKAKGKAKQIACANNLKQIGVGLILYANDHENTFPACISGSTTWDKAIFTYVRNKKLFVCPSDFEMRRAGNNIRSYSINDEAHKADNSFAGTKQDRCPDPANFVLVTEWAMGAPIDPRAPGGNCLFSTFYEERNDPPDYGDHGNLRETHADPMGLSGTCYGEGNNYLFFDGHAKFMKWWLVRVKLTTKNGNEPDNHWWFKPSTGKTYNPNWGL